MNWLSAAVAALVVPLIFQFFRRSQRRRIASLRERYDLANLEAKYAHYRKWEVTAILLLLLPLCGLATFGSYKFLTWKSIQKSWTSTAHSWKRSPSKRVSRSG